MKMVSYLENKMIHDLIQGEKADLTQLKTKLTQKNHLNSQNHKSPISPLYYPQLIHYA